MSTINRPTASNYNELETKRQTLSGKADSVFSYRKVNPYSVVFDKLKRDKNENLDDNMWQQAANKGELDQYVNLLSQNPSKSGKLADLQSKYSNFIDYDTAMLALSYDAIKDDTKEERFDSEGNSIGSFTQKELIEKVLEQETLRWDAQILEDAKRSGTFWQKAGARIKSAGVEILDFGATFAGAVIRVGDQTVDTLYAASTVLDEWISRGMDMSFEQISATYASASGSDDRGLNINVDATKIEEGLKAASFEIRRKYSYHVNAVTGESDMYGKILTGMADSMGYMSLSMLTGNPAMMYLPMFTGNVQENVAMSGPNPNYSKILTNAATKAGVEYGIEWGLGKLLGFTKLDNLTGIGDDAAKATKEAVTKGVTATTKQAAGMVAARTAKDMLKEGTEEVLQDLSGNFIDYLYGDQYATRSKENFTLENLTQSFVIGAATSFAIGSFSNMTTTRATGIDSEGFTYKMGMFKSVTYKQAVATMNSWQQIAMDPKADVNARLDAAMKLQGVAATLGTVYESAGIKNTIQAEKLLSEIQNYQDRKTAIKDKVQRGVYITDMLTNLDNEVGGTNWTTAFADVMNGTNNLMYDMQEAGTQRKEQNKIDKKQQAMYHSISTALHNTAVQQLAIKLGMTKIDAPIDLTGEVEKGSIEELLKNLGFNALVKSDANEIIDASNLTSENIVIIPETTTDVQALLKDIVTQNTISRAIENMPAVLLTNVIDTYSQAIGTASTKYDDADLARQAVAALMFDKNFQLKMLIKTKENSNTWGTDTVIDFIKSLQKQVVKKYDTVPVEIATTANKPIAKVKPDTTKLEVAEKKLANLEQELSEYREATNKALTLKRDAMVKTEINPVEVTKYDVTPPITDRHAGYERVGKVSTISSMMATGTSKSNDTNAFTVVTYHGINIPFFLAMESTSDGIVKGRWYPFVGASDSSVNKGRSEDLRNFYGSKPIRYLSEYLDERYSSTDAVKKAKTMVNESNYDQWKHANEDTMNKFSILDKERPTVENMGFQGLFEEDYAKISDGLPLQDRIAKANQAYAEDMSKESPMKLVLRAEMTAEATIDPEAPTAYDITNKLEAEIKAAKSEVAKEKASLKTIKPTAPAKPTTPAKSKRVLSDITKNISNKVIESLDAALVVYNTTVKRSTETDAKGKTVLKKKLKEVITSASEQKILADQNVQFSVMLDKLKNDKLDITPEDKAFIHRMVTQLHSDPSNTDVLVDIMIAEQIRDAEDGKIDGSTINSSKPSIQALEARILKIFTTGTPNARLDLHSTLTFEFARTNVMAKNKLHYLPIDESNLNEFPEARDTRTSIEKSMLGGQTIIDVIEGNADYSLLSPSLTDFDDDFDTNEITRFYAINNLFKQKTGSRFAILQNGALIKTSDSTEDLNAELVTAVANGKLREGIDALRATKKNGILTIQDFYSAKVPANIGKVPVSFSETRFAHGYHLKNGIIEVAFGSAETDVANFAVILHEMIHAVNSTTFTDLRYKQVGGSSTDLTKAMNLVDKGTKDSIGEYIRANFPITALRSMVLYEEHTASAIGDALYRLLYEENTARSVNHLYQFSSLGFDYKLVGNNMYLVSPDGKRNWTVKENMPVEPPTTLGDVKLKATAFESWVLKDNNPELDEIAKATEITEVENIVAEWRSTAGLSVTHLSQNYDTIVADIKANIIASYPDINLINLDRLLDNFFRFKPLFLNKFDIADSSTYRMKTLLNAVQQYGSSMARLSATATYVGVINKSKRSKLMKDLVGQLNTQIVNPVKNFYMANTILYEVAETNTAEPATNAFQAPTSFNFGDYSFTKHTGRTYMLTHKPAGQSRYTTQEVDMDTLLPTRRGQKPILTDNTMRERMLFVIAKKTEVAEKKDKEPALPEPPKKAKSNEVVFQWGAWTVKNYNKDNYIVSKTASDKASTDDQFEAIQIVSKKTLLPDTMLNAKGKPVLSATERSNILDWIAHDTSPQIFKVENEDPAKERYIYRPNLSDKNAEPMTKEAIEDFEDSELYDYVPGNMSPYYKLGLTWVTQMAKFYKKYPSLRAWVEGNNEKNFENMRALSDSREEAFHLLYTEIYKQDLGIKNDYQKSGKELEAQWNRFLKAPIYFIRTQTTKNVDRSIPLNSVTIGYNLDNLPIFGHTDATTNEPMFAFYGKIKLTDLLGFLPNSYAEGILVPGHFAVNPPLEITGTRQEFKATIKSKLEDLTKPTLKEPKTNAFAAPNPNRAYVSNTTAKKSNLKYFIKKGKPIQMHSDVIDFVEGTTTDFDKLSKFFKDRILKGKLTRHDVAKYIHTTKSINAYTWKAIAQFIYHNEALADIGPTMAKFFLDKDRLEKYAIMTRLTEDLDTTLKINSITDFKKFENEFNAKLNSDPELIEKYTKATEAATAWWSYDETGKLTKRDDLVIDEKQLLPIFMRHYDGSLKSLNDIFTLAKRQAGQQLLTSLYENTSSSGNNANANKTTKISSGNAATENNTVGAKTGSSGVYNWLDNIRKNTVDYETTPELEEDATTFEELTPEDKYNMLYDYLYAEELSYTDNPTEQEEYMADEDVTSALSKMSEADIDKVTQFILNEARNATPTQVTTTEEANSDTPARKTLKDGLRNKTKTLIRRLAGLKTNYNKLAPEVQALINFSVNKSTLNTEAYTNLSDAELITLNDKVAAEVETLKVAQKQAQELEKTKASILRKVKALQKKERLLAEKEAHMKARATAIKEGKTLREKLKVSYEAKVAKQTFTITGPTIINPKLQTILDHTWNKNTESKVKYMDDSVQTIQNVHNATEFYKAHATELSEMTLADIEDITEWLIGSNIATSDSVAKQTFEATKFFILAYIYNETGAKHIFNGMNSNLKLQLGNHLKAIQTSAGTLLSLVKQVKDKLNPVSVIAVELFDRFEYKISDIDQERLDKALSTGNVKDITQVLHDIKKDALKNLVPEKVTASRKVAAIRSMSMTSSPMTWVRNIISNIALTNLNPLSTKLGNIFFPKLTAKTENTATQFKLDGQITPEIQTFITEQFINSGFFDETVDQISKYNPSQILRHKKAGDSDIIGDMLVHAIYNQFYSESMFDSNMFNTIHAFLMRRLSDKKWVREASVTYLGKLLAETGYHLDKAGKVKTGVDDDVMKIVANAFALATTDYMHSDNAFSHLEQRLSQNSPVFWSAYKIVMPFATASWNWFKAAIRYSPIGLGQAIYKLTHLEQEILKTETKWKKGESQIAPELATYLVRRDLGSGIIGTMAFGFGAILAALGFISLEDDDWGTPKLRIGNLRVDVSSIFGSSSALAGAAFVNTFKNTKDLGEALDAMAEPLVDGFFFTDLLSMDANSPEGWFEWSKYQAQSVMLSFIPSMVRYVSGATYTGTYRAKTSFQRAVSRLPFLGSAFNVPKHTNVYTGDQDGTMWDIVHRLLPYFEIVTKSQSQSMTEQYGLNKEELNGTYIINDSSFKTDPKETARINKLYGELNADDLVDFYANKSTYRVLGANGKYATKYYSQMTETEIGNALSQLFSKNSTTAKVSAWLAAGHTYYTNDRELFNTLRALGYNNVFIGNKGFVE